MDKPTFGDLTRLTDREVEIVLSRATDGLRKKCLSNMSVRARTFIEVLAEVARAEGIPALESQAKKMGDPFMQSALRRVH